MKGRVVNKEAIESRRLVEADAELLMKNIPEQLTEICHFGQRVDLDGYSPLKTIQYRRVFFCTG